MQLNSNIQEKNGKLAMLEHIPFYLQQIASKFYRQNGMTWAPTILKNSIR